MGTNNEQGIYGTHGNNRIIDSDGAFFHEDGGNTEQNGGKPHVGAEISGICEKGKIAGDIG